MGRLLILWVFALGLLGGCVPSKEVRSAGQVGCSPEEISVSSDDYHFGLVQSGESWVATCRGRTFVCSQVNETGDRDKGLGTFLGSHQVSCREQVESPEAESQRFARQAAATADAIKARDPLPPPTGAAGFDFGVTRQEAQRRCEAAGNEWSAADRGGSCSGAAVDVGPVSGVSLGWCDGRMCSIDIEQHPEKWSRSIVELKGRLEAKYGRPAESPGPIPKECRSDAQLAQCLASNTFAMRYFWSWSSGESLELSVGKPGARAAAPPAIRLSYRRSGASLSASGL